MMMKIDQKLTCRLFLGFALCKQRVYKCIPNQLWQYFDFKTLDINPNHMRKKLVINMFLLVFVLLVSFFS